MADPVQRRNPIISDIGGAPITGAGAAPPAEAVRAVARTEVPPAIPKPRRSRAIVLSLVGLGALAAGYGVYDAVQGDEAEVASEERREGYSSREDCERNYSKDQCTSGQTYRPGVGFVPVFWGPYYGAGAGSAFQGRSSTDPGPGRARPGIVTETRPAATSARGGFGSSAGGYSGSAGS